MYKRKLLFFIVAGLAICSSPACGRLFPCCPPTNELFKQSEAESISGVKLRLAYELRDDKRSSCGYVNGLTGDDLYSVGLDLHRFKEGDGPANEVAHRGTAAKFLFEVENVAGIGDSAFFSQDGDAVSLYARKGTLGLQLRARSVLPPNEAREKLLAVAGLIMERLE